MYKFMTALSILLAGLLLAMPALAQQDPVEAEEIADEQVDATAPEGEQVEFDWFEDDDWNLTVFLPSGGQYYAPEDLGIMPEDDPMSYPLIWITEEQGLPFNMQMFGILDLDVELTDADFVAYFDEFMRNVQADFPNLEQEVDAIQLHERVWDRFIVADEEGNRMINYLAYVDDTFYSCSFLSSNMVTLEDAIDGTVAQLDVTFLLSDEVPQEDILLPWYF